MDIVFVLNVYWHKRCEIFHLLVVIDKSISLRLYAQITTSKY